MLIVFPVIFCQEAYYIGRNYLVFYYILLITRTHVGYNHTHTRKR